jgi:hypothetical protein
LLHCAKAAFGRQNPAINKRTITTFFIGIDKK